MPRYSSVMLGRWLVFVLLCCAFSARAQRLSTPALDDSRADVMRAIEKDPQAGPAIGSAFEQQGRALDLIESGRYREALPLLEAAQRVFLKHLSPGNQLLAANQNQLGYSLKKLGLYRQAELAYLRSVATLYRQKNGDRLSMAQAIDNLGNLFHDRGEYNKARWAYTTALKLEEEVGASEDIAKTLDNLALLDLDRGRVEDADKELQRALKLVQATPPRDAALLPIIMDGRGMVAMDKGEFRSAEQFYRQAESLWRTRFGPEHPDRAVSLVGRADAYLNLGQLDPVKDLLNEAEAIRRAAWGSEHTHTRAVKKRLARYSLARGEVREAVALLNDVVKGTELELLQGDTEALMASILSSHYSLDEDIYAVLANFPKQDEVLRLALATALLHKGRSVDQGARVSAAISSNLTDPARRAKFQKYQQNNAELAAMYRIADRRDPAYWERLGLLEAQRNNLEEDLAATGSRPSLPGELPAADIVERVARALPQDGILIEIVLGAPRGFGAAVKPPRPVESRFFALILEPGGQVRAAPLGLAREVYATARLLIDSLRYRRTDVDKHAQDLHRMILRPIEPLIKGRRQLFYSPEGVLQLVPLGVLHDGTPDGYAALRYTITYLTSGRDLLWPAQAANERAPVVFANPLFGPGVKSLQGTADEAQAIYKLFPSAQILQQEQASKAALLKVSAPYFLHLATHGEFLEDLPQPTAPSLAARGAVALHAAPPRPAYPPHGQPFHPLARAALLWFGARNPPESKALSDGDEGRSTALEVSSLNLHGTRLVVLSACDTARGDVRIGNGVYGLRRAFLIAGAQTVVSSLWKVDDVSTSMLIEAFYTNLTAGMGRSEALAQAALSLRQNPQIKKYQHPYYWAPFIAIGNPGPLPELAKRRAEP